MVSPSTSTSEIIPLYRFTPAQFLVIAVDVIQELGWEIDNLSDAVIIKWLLRDLIPDLHIMNQTLHINSSIERLHLRCVVVPI
jgi:hypothetical protein